MVNTLASGAAGVVCNSQPLKSRPLNMSAAGAPADAALHNAVHKAVHTTALASREILLII
jgi:hypothetical protein